MCQGYKRNKSLFPILFHAFLFSYATLWASMVCYRDSFSLLYHHCCCHRHHHDYYTHTHHYLGCDTLKPGRAHSRLHGDILANSTPHSHSCENLRSDVYSSYYFTFWCILLQFCQCQLSAMFLSCYLFKVSSYKKAWSFGTSTAPVVCCGLSGRHGLWKQTAQNQM
jgi:hypothetical protein